MCPTSEDKVGGSKYLAADHRAAQTLPHDGETHGYNEQHEEAERIPAGVEDCDNEQERGSADAFAVRVQVAVVY
jgi:hypothetical protein